MTTAGLRLCTGPWRTGGIRGLPLFLHYNRPIAFTCHNVQLHVKLVMCRSKKISKKANWSVFGKKCIYENAKLLEISKSTGHKIDRRRLETFTVFTCFFVIIFHFVGLWAHNIRAIGAATRNGRRGICVDFWWSLADGTLSMHETFEVVHVEVFKKVLLMVDIWQ